jgi:predicted Zn-dependent peptidase
MKKLILSIILILSSYNLFAQDINPDVKPEPIKTDGFKFPAYTIRTLSNGLDVYFIEDKEQPTIALRLMIFGGSSVEQNKAGIAELTASMLTKGTKTRTANQIANTLDGVGTDVSSSAAGDYYMIYASGLKKHSKLILDVMSDVLLNPTFPADEFIKMQQQTIASIQYEKSNPGNAAQQLSRIAVFGKDHPYSRFKTEESVNSITIDDLKTFHSTWAKPGNASLAVVGDVKPDEIINELEKYFKNWKAGKTPKIEIPEPKQMPKGIYFINRKGAVQSSIVATTLAVPYNNSDYEKIQLATKVIGGDNGRLFQTLREKYSFTYSPYGFITASKYANRFAAVADVAAEKTDSSLAVIIAELNDMKNETPRAEEVKRVKTSYLGNYNMSFENSMFIASLIQNEEFYGKKINELKNYPKRIESLTPSDITVAVKSYINSDNLRIIIAGDPKVLPSIEKYGQIFQYDLDLNPLSGADAKLEKISLSANELISKYESAIGGKDNIQKIQTLNAVSTAELSVNGQLITGDVLSQKKFPNKLYNFSDFKIFNSQSWVDGENCWTGSKDQPSTIQSGESKDKMLFDAEMFSVLNLVKHKYTLNVLGKLGKMILMSAVSPAKSESVYYFNADNYLLEKIELNLKAPDGNDEIWTIVSADYSLFDGVMLPKTQKTISPNFVITLKTNYTVNQPIDDAVFKPAM